jgi:hypothetical protein
MKIWFIPLLCAMLSGCMTAQERMAQDDTQCLSYGVPKGSPAYVQCRTQLDQNRANKQAAASFGNSGGLIGAIERSANQ